jgi:hypothetical protein
MDMAIRIAALAPRGRADESKPRSSSVQLDTLELAKVVGANRRDLRARSFPNPRDRHFLGEANRHTSPGRKRAVGDRSIGVFPRLGRHEPV